MLFGMAGGDAINWKRVNFWSLSGMAMADDCVSGGGLNLSDTELRLAPPGSGGGGCGRGWRSSKPCSENSSCRIPEPAPTPSRGRLVGWPPVRNHGRNNVRPKKTTEVETAGIYVKVSMDGALFLRKIDLKIYRGYHELLQSLEEMFKITIGDYCEREGYKGSEYAPTYEDKDGDWMLVGDVPWDMFITSCRRLRVVKGADAKGLA